MMEGGKSLSDGARAIVKGGWNGRPKTVFPGGALVGGDAGYLNFAKMKDNHTARKSGMLAAEAIAEKLKAGSEGGDVLTALPEKFKASWLFDELDRSRSFGAAIHKFGALIGGKIGRAHV